MKLALTLGCLFVFFSASLPAQSINSGTVNGTITDQSGAALPRAVVTLRNAVSGFQESATTDATGAFRFVNIALNPYQLTVAASGFEPISQQVDIKSAVPVMVNISLKVSGGATSVTVEAAAINVENDPSAHVDVDRSLIDKLPAFDPEQD